MRFLHTADWQLGKPYARVTDPDKRSQLTDTAAHRHSRKLCALHAQGLQVESRPHTT